MTETAWASRCLRCGDTTALRDDVSGCRSCAVEGVAMPMVPRGSATDSAPPPDAAAGQGPMWRWRSHLPPVGEPVTLGEGGTPLTEVRLPDVPGRTLIKDERANPTGSFKDRLASAAVSRARHVGATTVVVSSTGNAGIAVAAYAAAAGLRAVVLVSRGLSAQTGAALESLGACVLAAEDPSDRWTAARTGVEHLGWYPVSNHHVPPVASNPVGVHAYRTIAFEIAASLTWSAPDWVVVPVSRGDGLFGIWGGFAELIERGWTSTVPRMLAVERLPSLSEALAGGLEQPDEVRVDEPVRARSIGDARGTAMSLHTLRASGGTAVSATDAEIEASWRRLAAVGQLFELSSAAVVHGALSLAARGELTRDSTVVLLGTAGPYAQESLTDPGAASRLGDPGDAVALGDAVERHFAARA